MSRVVIADLPINERPRERMARQGVAALSDTELLAILIEPGCRGKSSIDLAREVLADGLGALAKREWNPARPAASLGRSRVARIGAALELARRISSFDFDKGEAVDDPASLGTSLVSRYSGHLQERLGAVYFDSRNRIIRERVIYIGTLTNAAVSTRDILRFALEDGASSLLVFHNHPSGDPSPSAEDLVFTRTLVSAAKVMAVEVLDHLVLGANRFVSMKARALI
jgi:DNA repair protein RadC